MGGGSETASPSARTFSATLVSSAEGSKRKVKGMLPSAYRNSGAIITVDRVFSRGSALIQKKMKADGFEKYSSVPKEVARTGVCPFAYQSKSYFDFDREKEDKRRGVGRERSISAAEETFWRTWQIRTAKKMLPWCCCVRCVTREKR